MKIFPTLQKLNTFSFTFKKKKSKFFFYSILKNFSFFYNKFYFKFFIRFRIKNKNSLSFLIRKVFSLKK
jgi:hypothetical protein